jgi:subtilisin family serine protease
MLLPMLGACAKFSEDVEIDSASGGGTGSPACALYCNQYGAQYETGTQSTRAAATAALLLGDNKNYGYGSYASLAEAHTALNGGAEPIASIDTGATAQWDAGWTGLGVKVGVLDAFDWTDGTVDDHGEYVALVVNSVAPEATLNMRHTDLTISDIHAAWAALNTDGYHIINNSFGSARFDHTTGTENTAFDTDVALALSTNYSITGAATYDEDMLFVFAAGNSGAYCPDKRIHECTFNAAVLHRQRANGQSDKDAVLWVGALSDDGTTLAGYSHSAGEMSNDFMVAHDNVLTAGDASGTSFAAPRVAGAAALIRQKFPLLDGQELKSLLLNTTTDMGVTGPDPIFGKGKLNLNNALSPQGRLSAE